MLRQVGQTRALREPTVKVPVFFTPIYRRKPASQTVNNSATLVNDTHLVFPAGRDQHWMVRFVLLVNTGATPDVKFQLSVPSGAIARLLHVGTNAAGTFVEQDVAAAADLTVNGTGARKLVILEAHIQMGATPGDIRLQWAQNTATVSDTTVMFGSVMVAERIL